MNEFAFRFETHEAPPTANRKPAGILRQYRTVEPPLISGEGGAQRRVGLKAGMARQSGLSFARRLRHNMSLPEILIWSRIKVRQPDGPIFRRQYPYAPYVFDFFCAKAKLIIEVDGLAHTIDEQSDKDEVRDRYLRDRGFEVLRIAASDVLADPDEVAGGIYQLAAARLRGERA